MGRRDGDTLLTNQQNDAAEELAELRRRVRSLEEELKARDTFIVAAAHELRNPISPLVLHVDRLLAATRSAEDDVISARWLATQLGAFSSRLTRFLSALNRMLDVSQLHKGAVELMLEEVDLCEVTRDVAASFERELKASTSTLELEATCELRGYWDRMRLEQIVANLLSNAIRYGDGQPILVSVRQVGERAELVVRDHGIGIQPTDQQRIFERFERASGRGHAGFGVGLWVVRELCHAMAGEVEVSSSPSEGSTFTVRLPRTRDGRGG